jgi:hypothetical protein
MCLKNRSFCETVTTILYSEGGYATQHGNRTSQGVSLKKLSVTIFNSVELCSSLLCKRE